MPFFVLEIIIHVALIPLLLAQAYVAIQTVWRLPQGWRKPLFKLGWWVVGPLLVMVAYDAYGFLGDRVLDCLRPQDWYYFLDLTFWPETPRCHHWSMRFPWEPMIGMPDEIRSVYSRSLYFLPLQLIWISVWGVATLLVRGIYRLISPSDHAAMDTD